MGVPSLGVLDRARRNGRMSGEMQNEELLYLLRHRVSPGAGTARTQLLELMGQHAWWVVRGPHESADANPHITIECHRDRYHLQLDGSGNVFRITPGEGRVLGNEPSSAPGAAPGRMRRG